MFSFLPQLFIVLSLAGIVVILLRKAPGVTDFVAKTPAARIPVQGAKIFGGKLKEWGKLGLQKLWHFVLEVKDLSKTSAFSHLPQTFSKIHLPKASLNLFKHADSPEYYFKQGQESLEKGEYEEAERKFIKVIEKDPHNEEAFTGLGKLYLAQKKFEDAIETYKYLLKNYPANDGYYSYLGQAYHGQKLYDQAIEAYERAIELNPDSARRYINLGLTLEAKKHVEEAILNYRKALTLEKNNPQFLLILAEALIKKGDKEEAEVLLEQILQLEPTNHLAREKLMQLKF